MKTYNPLVHGAVTAIRIFIAEDYHTHMAELAFAFGGTETIRWDNCAEREKYSSGINAYTLFFDERFPSIKFRHCVRRPYEYVEE